MKNIMLLFLSDVKISDGKVSEAFYEGIGKTRTTNESAVAYVLQSLRGGDSPETIDKMFVFVTKRVGGKMTFRNQAGAVVEYQEGGRGYTHESYFIEAVGERMPNIENVIVRCAYDEDKPASEALDMVLEMSNEVQQYIDTLGGEPATMHADLTGGMRHANMMMLNVMRLLQYNDVHIGKLVYSNFKGASQKSCVEEATDIYQFFDLIAGAEEFVRFGSVAALVAYYDRKEGNTAELNALIDQMKDFSNKIKLCHYGEFKNAVARLRDCLMAFQRKRDDDKNSRLLLSLMPRIMKEYKELLDGESSDLDLIAWCVQRDYLQQAMTLYIEYIPQYLYENQILTVASAKQEEFMAGYKGRREKNSGKAYFMVNSLAEAKNGQGDRSMNRTEKNQLYEKLKALMAGMKHTPYDEDIANAVLDAFERDAVKGNYYIDYRNRLHKQMKRLDRLYQDPETAIGDKEIKQYVMQYYVQDCLKNDEQKEKFNQLSAVQKGKKICNYFANNLTVECLDVFFGYKAFARHPRAIAIEALLAEGYLATPFPQETVVRLIDDYGWVKLERNNSNHARDEEAGRLLQEVKDRLGENVARLRALKGWAYDR